MDFRDVASRAEKDEDWFAMECALLKFEDERGREEIMRQMTEKMLG